MELLSQMSFGLYRIITEKVFFNSILKVIVIFKNGQWEIYF